MSRPVIIHVPHASTTIPEHERDKLAISGEDLRRELLRMTDRYADDLFAAGGDAATRLIFPVSRLVVDPERFADDAAEPMAGRGMGAVYTKTSDGRPLRSSLDAKERQRLLETYYRPHHEMLERLVGEALASCGQALIIDGHSFPFSPLPCDLDQAPIRPDICIGTDPFHTPEWLQRTAANAFRELGWSVEINRPYAGSMVPMAFYRKDVRVHSIMVEIKRALYLDEYTGERLAQFGATSGKVRSALEMLTTSVPGSCAR